MTYAIIDSRLCESKEACEENYRRNPTSSGAAFVVYLWNLGHAEFLGLYNAHEGRAFHFDPRHPERGVKELKWDGKAWRKP